MRFRFALNDLRRSPGVNLALLLVLTLSACLMASGAIVLERTLGSVDRLFEQARPPHLLQMHTGEYDRAALERFAAGRPEIADWLVEEAIGFDGAAVDWRRPAEGAGGDLSDSLVDNLFVVQNERFDQLVDESGAAPDPAAGEVHVPIAYREGFDLRIGDVLRVGTGAEAVELTIAGFVRDAQMGSSLASATRFLVSEQDFRALADAGGGAPEIIVEYRFHDPAQADAVRAAYAADPALPKNGELVDSAMIRLVNAFSDGLVAFALAFASLLLIAIALLSVRFVIRGTLEDEVRRIGAMKAIGLPASTISGLYLWKYAMMALASCLLGGLIAVLVALPLSGVQLGGQRAPFGPWTVAAPGLALLCVFLIVVGICSGVLRRIRRVRVVSALVHGTLRERSLARRPKRRASRFASGDGEGVGLRLVLADLRAEPGQWLLVPIVFLLASVLMTLPASLLHTIESPDFVRYMGAPRSDLRVDLLHAEDLDGLREGVVERLRADERIAEVRLFSRELYEVDGPEGRESFRVEIGDHSAASIEFLEGRAPGEGEIALSRLNAEKLGLRPGEALELSGRRGALTATVSGVYQDVTGGGYSAKMQGEPAPGASAYLVYADTRPGADPVAVAEEYERDFPDAAVVPMREYVEQTFAYVTGALRGATVLSLVFALGTASLIVCLHLGLRIARERRRMGILAAIGFSRGQIAAQLRLKTMIAVAPGVLAGVLVATTLGEPLVGGLMSMTGLGVSKLAFSANPWLVSVLFPLLLMAVGYLSALLVSARIGRADASAWLRS
ncbi:MAG: ABC transporter permease [Pseudoclavibacter sp.]|nr:ABC transporter permease [Pseudoclavibacter sp.]